MTGDGRRYVVGHSGVRAPLPEAQPERVGTLLDAMPAKESRKRGGGERTATRVRKHQSFTVTELAGLGQDGEGLARERDAVREARLRPVGRHSPKSPLKVHLVPGCAKDLTRTRGEENDELERKLRRRPSVGLTKRGEHGGNLGIRKAKGANRLRSRGTKRGFRHSPGLLCTLHARDGRGSRSSSHRVQNSSTSKVQLRRSGALTSMMLSRFSAWCPAPVSMFQRLRMVSTSRTGQ